MADQHGGAHPLPAPTTAPSAVCHLLLTGPVAGRATPTLLLFTILLLLLVEVRAFQRADHAAIACWLQPLLAQAPFIVVPLPPPRPLSSGLAE